MDSRHPALADLPELGTLDRRGVCGAEGDGAVEPRECSGGRGGRVTPALRMDLGGTVACTEEFLLGSPRRGEARKVSLMALHAQTVVILTPWHMTGRVAPTGERGRRGMMLGWGRAVRNRPYGGGWRRR